MARLPLALAALALLGACGCGARDTAEPRAASVQSAIVNGQPDTTHQAVVSVTARLGDGTASLCSGTIIGVTGTTGVVLTAAHCVLSRTHGVADPTSADITVMMGDDLHTAPSSSIFAVSELEVHPLYAVADPNSPYDFALLAFAGAGEGTPVIPALRDTDDRLAPGDLLPFLGFGETSTDGSSSNTARNVTHLPIGALTPLTFSYDESQGGTCHGDSGGPALVVVRGQERVAGVTSDASELSPGACNGTGRSGRVSTVYADWIAPRLLGTRPATTRSCPQVDQGATQRSLFCGSTIMACQRDAGCTALVNCLSGCSVGDSTCAGGCRAQHKAGEQIYLGFAPPDAAAPSPAAPGCSLPGAPPRPVRVPLLPLVLLAALRPARAAARRRARSPGTPRASGRGET